MGRLIILNEKGDETLTWDPDDKQSTDAAKARYDVLKTQGYEFYAVSDGGRGERIKRWSKKLGTIIAAPGVKTAEDKTTGGRPKAMAGGPNAWRI